MAMAQVTSPLTARQELTAHYFVTIPRPATKVLTPIRYRYQVWAYDLNDWAAVRAGQKQPWDVVPYGVWPLTLPTPEPMVRLGGVGYDAERQIVYVSQLRADPDGYSSRPVIHAFRIALPKPVR